MGLSRWLGAWFGLGWGIVSAACGGADTFACSDDSSCSNGRCESNGYCSFPADDCESGWQFGDFSGPFSGQCVPNETETETGSTGASTLTTTSGVDTTGSAEMTGDSTDSDTPPDTDAECSPSQTCRELPGDPWTLVTMGSDASDCADGEPLVTAAGAYDGPWTCACGCSADAPTSCSDLPISLQLFAEPECEGDTVLSQPITPMCQDTGLLDAYYVDVEAEWPWECVAETDLIAEPIVPLDPQVACAAEAGGSCSSGSCIEDGPNVCVYADGDWDCPNGDFPARTVLYRGSLDQRECEPCGCEATASCDGDLNLYPDGCGIQNVVTVEIGECTESPFVVQGAAVMFDGEPDVSCGATGGQSLGGVVADGPVTVCCPE